MRERHVRRYRVEKEKRASRALNASKRPTVRSRRERERERENRDLLASRR